MLFVLGFYVSARLGGLVKIKWSSAVRGCSCNSVEV